jgi:FSR family fosmidomycin resistance protein-like MFS transporter
VTVSHHSVDVNSHRASTAEGFQTGHVLTVSLAHALNDVYTSFLPPLLPVLIARMALSNTQAGLLAFMQSSPSLLQPVVGYLADRASLRYFVVLVPALTATAMSLLGVAPRYAVVALLVTIAGLLSATFHASAPAMAGRLSGGRLGRGLGFWTVGGYLGYAVGPILVSTTINLATPRSTPWLMIGGWAGSAVLYLRLRGVSLTPPAPSTTHSWRHGMERIRPLLLPVAGIVMARAMAFSATLTFLPTLLTNQGVDLWLAGISLSLVQGVSAVGALLAGSASDRMGRRSIAFATTAVAPVLLAALVILPGWPQVPVLIGLGIVMPATYVILLALMQECCPDDRALATGVLLSMTFISESLGAVVLGVLADLFSLSLAFVVTALVLAASLPLILLLPQNPQTLPQGSSTT